MRTRRRLWAVLLAMTTVVAIVFTAGYVFAAVNQYQGNLTKQYVRSADSASTNFTSWVLVPDLSISGTWKPNDLLVARLSATSRCESASGVAGACLVRISLDCLDEGTPFLDFLPTLSYLDPFDSASGTAADAVDAEGLITTRYLPLPRGTSAGCVVIVEIEVNNAGLTFTLEHPVLTLNVSNQTAT
jgi:hypothetical protein